MFQSLQLNYAPVFLYFSEKGKVKSPEQMDIQRVGFGAETIARWIAEKTDIQIRVIRPPNYSGTLALLILFALIGALLYMRRNNLDFLYNRTSWALAAIVSHNTFIFLTNHLSLRFESNEMFVKIEFTSYSVDCVGDDFGPNVESHPRTTSYAQNPKRRVLYSWQ